jgi:hypothetical protein
MMSAMAWIIISEKLTDTTYQAVLFRKRQYPDAGRMRNEESYKEYISKPATVFQKQQNGLKR